jgi:hypothetical protein
MEGKRYVVNDLPMGGRTRADKSMMQLWSILIGLLGVRRLWDEREVNRIDEDDRRSNP